MCFSPRLWFCACKTATLAFELLVSMGPRPHLCFLHAKQRLLDQNNKSLWVPDITRRFVHAIQRDYNQNNLSLWIPALICGFCMQNSAFWTGITNLYGSQTHLSFCACNTAWLAPESLVSMGPNPYLWFLHSKQRLLDSNNKSLRVPYITCRFVHTIQCD